ncbi:PREDICTED: cytokinesis protein sepH-like [Nicotiana attenuata]|uniref:cytokinesis protein sepH-like n=1 Tax=Nicotiana attenuata TaxID=49451 RepID=UPI00090544EC|nr:PREDICTED: cytokinesis protein sepH-like [Nicotiana attenuata]
MKALGAGSYGTVFLAAPKDGSSTFVESAEVKDSSSLSMEGRILDALKGSPYSKTMVEEIEVAYYAFQLLTGISHVHRKGFIHCDLKSSNILVFPTVDDEYDSTVDKTKHIPTGIEAPTSVVIIEGLCSVAHGIHGKAVDIWALGCIVVEMITGRRLWLCHKNSDDLDFKITHEEPVIPSNVSNICKDFLVKCFEKDHNWRWTADMLLNHPFIKNAMSGKYHPEDHELISNKVIINPFSHCESRVSKRHFFSTCFHLPSSDNFRSRYAIFPAENAQCRITKAPNYSLPLCTPTPESRAVEQEQSEYFEGAADALQKVIDARVNKALQTLVSRLHVAPPTLTPNNNTLENPRSGLINSRNGRTPSEPQEGEPGSASTESDIPAMRADFGADVAVYVRCWHRRCTCIPVVAAFSLW